MKHLPLFILSMFMLYNVTIISSYSHDDGKKFITSAQGLNSQASIFIPSRQALPTPTQAKLVIEQGPNKKLNPAASTFIPSQQALPTPTHTPTQVKLIIEQESTNCTNQATTSSLQQDIPKKQKPKKTVSFAPQLTHFQEPPVDFQDSSIDFQSSSIHTYYSAFDAYKKHPKKRTIIAHVDSQVKSSHASWFLPIAHLDNMRSVSVNNEQYRLYDTNIRTNTQISTLIEDNIEDNDLNTRNSILASKLGQKPKMFVSFLCNTPHAQKCHNIIKTFNSNRLLKADLEAPHQTRYIPNFSQKPQLIHIALNSHDSLLLDMICEKNTINKNPEKQELLNILENFIFKNILKKNNIENKEKIKLHKALHQGSETYIPDTNLPKFPPFFERTGPKKLPDIPSKPFEIYGAPKPVRTTPMQKSSDQKKHNFCAFLYPVIKDSTYQLFP